MFTKKYIYIVTGGSSGIGADISLELNKLGASVICIGRDEEKLNAVRSRAESQENFYIEVKDLAKNVELLDSFMHDLKEKYGKVTGLVLCAGTTAVQPLQLIDLTSINNMFNINYTSAILLLKAFCHKSINTGENASAVVVSSLSAIQCKKGQALYAGSKAALTASVKAIAKEVVTKGVRVNIVSPSDIDTSMTQESIYNNFLQNRTASYPLGIGKVEDVSQVILFLLSEKAKWINAQEYAVDCGSM